MKANAPENIYLQVCGDCHQTDCESCKFEDFEDNVTWSKDKIFKRDIEYTRTDAFIEKALKWYCLDCECNDNCNALHNCFFKSEFKRYLEGADNALPPKLKNALNPDGSTSDNYRYRHFIGVMKDKFIEKAKKWFKKQNEWFDSNGNYRCNLNDFEDFKNYMKGE